MNGASSIKLPEQGILSKASLVRPRGSVNSPMQNYLCFRRLQHSGDRFIHWRFIKHPYEGRLM